MCRIMEELAEEERAKEREATLLESIKSLMSNLKFTPQQAMEALNIPADQREKLAAKL